MVFENTSYVNDHLKQEFSERVSQKRKVILCSKLSEALKHFAVQVTKKEEEAELELVTQRGQLLAATGMLEGAGHLSTDETGIYVPSKKK